MRVTTSRARNDREHGVGPQGLGMLGRLAGLEELAVNSDDVDRRMAFAVIGRRLTQLPPSWANLKQVRFGSGSCYGQTIQQSTLAT